MRKSYILLNLFIVMSLVLAACGGAAPVDAPAADDAMADSDSSESSDSSDSDGAMAEMSEGEAPMLAEMVAAGDLPPVEERLPIEPLVIEPVDSIGQYGGKLRRAYLGPADGCNYWRISRGGLFRFSVDGFEIIPAEAKGVESNDDGTEWTVFLREGMKWSDGDPFDANDFMWHYENVLTNEELTPAKPGFLRSGDDFATMEAIDDYTIKFTYPNPNFLFLEVMAQADQACGGASRNIPYTPSHYMEQFHADFNDEAQAMAEEAGFEDWTQLYDDKVAHNTNPERPVTRPWKFDNALGDQVVTATRNPYFYAVDTAGNQLPYIDEVTFTLVEDLEVISLKATQGEIDFQGRHIKMENIPTLKQGEEAGGYVVNLWPTFGGADVTMFPNMSYEGPEGEFLRQATFRQALSIAIDREAIREISMLGMGVPRMSVPAPGHPHYPGEEWEFKWTEYDVAKANEMLDEIMPDRDEDGFRTNADGDRINLLIGTTPAFGAWPDVAQQVSGYWAEVGIRAEVEELTRSLLTTRNENNEFAIYVWNEDTTGFTFSTLSKRIPEGVGNITAPGWGQWYDSGGEEGAVPEEWMQAFIDKHLMGPTLPEEERNALAQEIYRELVDNVYNIGIVGLSPMVQGVLVTNANLQNVPEIGGNDWPLRTPSTAYPEQLWYSE